MATEERARDRAGARGGMPWATASRGTADPPGGLRPGPAWEGAVIPLAYNLTLAVASPALAGYLAYRLAIRGKSRQGFLQRLGLAPRLPPPGPAGRVWLHAVSAGEMTAAAAIARRLREESPETEVVVSTTTPTGRAQAERLLPEAHARFYFPFDLLPCVALALRRISPTVIASVETEIWPNWFWLARRMGIRTALVNGQFTDRGFCRARRARRLYRWALRQVEALAMQTDRAAARALDLGAAPERVRVVGNVKFEQPLASARPEVASQVLAAFGATDATPVWVAGSTHAGEEAAVIQAFLRARERVPGLRLLLAPRHPERVREVAALLDGSGVRWIRRSELDRSDATDPVEVVVLDTMGELASLYALARVVFVGGSLVPVGGHDVLQPLFHGRPVLFGPHMQNQRDIARAALEAGAAFEVTDAVCLAEQVVRCCSADGDERVAIRAAAERLIRENRGAARECARLLAALARGEPEP